jgi:hypothetical protein
VVTPECLPLLLVVDVVVVSVQAPRGEKSKGEDDQQGKQAPRRATAVGGGAVVGLKRLPGGAAARGGAINDGGALLASVDGAEEADDAEAAASGPSLDQAAQALLEKASLAEFGPALVRAAARTWHALCGALGPRWGALPARPPLLAVLLLTGVFFSRLSAHGINVRPSRPRWGSSPSRTSTTAAGSRTRS